MPFGLFAPRPYATAAAAIIIVTQLWLIVSGNFSWLNGLAVLLAASVVTWPGAPRPGHLVPPPPWYGALVVALTAMVAVLSYWPARNLMSRTQRMNASFNPLHLVNTYGAFGSVTKTRYEVVVEGTDEPEVGPRTVWREYGFKGKPGDPHRRPPQVAPYHLRLDWQMWFAGLSSPYAQPWLVPFARKLLEGDRATLRLLRDNPFPDAPPAFVRARLWRYRFTTAAERRTTGAWWAREPAGEYLPPVGRDSLAGAGR